MKVPARERGSLLVVAVILIAVVAGLAAALSLMTAGSSESSARHAVAGQALFIAESGLERTTSALLTPAVAGRLGCAALNGNPAVTNVSVGTGRFSATTTGATYAGTVLSAALGAAATTVAVASTAGFAASGRIQIDRELIDYSGLGANSFLNAVRGADGTAASAHAAGARAGQFQCNVTVRGGVPSVTAPVAARDVGGAIALQELWAVGAAGRLLRWDSSTWSNGGSLANVLLNGVHLVAPADGWAVGDAVITGPPAQRGETILRRTSPAGWTRLAPSAAIPDANLNAVHCPLSTDCWAVGNAVTTGPPAQRGEIILRYSAGAWGRLGPLGTVDDRNLTGIHCPSSGACWAVGQQGPGAARRPWLVSWNGAAWSNYDSTALDAQSDLNAVTCTSTTDCWAVGNAVTTGPPAQRGEAIVRWNGAGWSRLALQAAVPDVNLNAVFCADSANCWIAGAASGGNGTILRWTGGPAWSRYPTAGIVPNAVLRAGVCVHRNDCWIVGDQSGGELLLHWDGNAWARRAPVGAIPNNNLRALTGLGPQRRPVAIWREIFP